jgi:SAM-dependent methyltransferase
MEPQILEAQRAYWNAHFSGYAPPAPPHAEWIDELLRRSSRRLVGNVLEIGCGRGHDTHYLIQAGCQVTVLDLSSNALNYIAAILPAARLVSGALPDPLPFRSATFAYVVAGLSLHYFRWADTLAIIQEIGRVLQPDGALIFRVNSTEDVAHGAGRGEEIEPNLFLYEGRYKRFFSEAMCRELFDSSWQLEQLIPRVENRFQEVKPTWMGISSRRAQNGQSIK